MPRGSTYANNSYNRSLGRVGAAMGSMPVSASSRSSGGGDSSSSGSRAYVDNSYNRSIGRVGAAMGSMPVSASSRSSGGGDSSSSGSRAYVDNSYNRSIGRVGAAMGSMPVSASSRSSGSSSSGSSVYVDNSYNRSVGRVGAAMGSMPVSASSRSSGGGDSSSSGSRVYVDNPYNRSVGRVGAAMGSMPVSASSRSSGGGDSSSSGSRAYVDNPYNRSVGRVGAAMGSMPVSQSSSSSVSKSPSSSASSASGTSSAGSGERKDGKVYKDNPFNRSLGRVGEPLGSMPHSRKASASTENFYVDNTLNRKLGRVGQKLGRMPVSKASSTSSRKKIQDTHIMREMYEQLLKPEPDDIGDLLTDKPQSEVDHMCDTVFSLIRRMNQALEWMESNQGRQPRTALETFKYDGPVIEFEEIQIMEKIGHGGFGDVHFGKYKGTVVAVKKLRVQRVSKQRLRQFQLEVEILCRLDHPRIVKFLGASIVTPHLAILLEYMQKSLYEALHVEEQDYTANEQHQILLDMADGLAYLHEMSVAHCDMKSTNILLDSIDGGIVAKISDFGLSLMKTEAETSQSTAKVGGVGTPKYSAPEVLAGEQLGLEAMCKADVYSMSVVAWEVLCQEVPFSGLNIHQLRRRVCSGHVDLRIPEDVQVGDGLQNLLKRCWSLDTNRRPSAQVFKACLAKLEGIQ